MARSRKNSRRDQSAQLWTPAPVWRLIFDHDAENGRASAELDFGVVNLDLRDRPVVAHDSQVVTGRGQDAVQSFANAVRGHILVAGCDEIKQRAHSQMLAVAAEERGHGRIDINRNARPG